ncbi:hypothetical protein [Fodinicola feengrottensis]|uniref:hypothetical protein n=1 Tax=Fodinicola feengrottensis TaxID=435914 RepID=UPI0024418382|nr:hypothetical protein [Fodinicola feengrottensis]
MLIALVLASRTVLDSRALLFVTVLAAPSQFGVQRVEDERVDLAKLEMTDQRIDVQPDVPAVVADGAARDRAAVREQV